MACSTAPDLLRSKCCGPASAHSLHQGLWRSPWKAALQLSFPHSNCTKGILPSLDTGLLGSLYATLALLPNAKQLEQGMRIFLLESISIKCPIYCVKYVIVSLRPWLHVLRYHVKWCMSVTHFLLSDLKGSVWLYKVQKSRPGKQITKLAILTQLLNFPI